MDQPLVSVICLCYNQGRFIEEAIQSVLNQTYPNIQLIIVDDASQDNSAEIIQRVKEKYLSVETLLLKQNIGNCKAFNKGLRVAKGEFIIDLAADDILLPKRIEVGVRALLVAGPTYGVHFSDADWISEKGEFLYRQSDRFPHQTIPTGNIYRYLISRFFICSPTMMYTQEVMNRLGGYDEDLLYEDFDFWIRSSRNFLYAYSPQVLAKKRIVKKSLSEKQFQVLSPQLKSTFRVCEKVLLLNHSVEEKIALRHRIFYEMKVCLKLLHFTLLIKYLLLYVKNERMRYG